MNYGSLFWVSLVASCGQREGAYGGPGLALNKDVVRENAEEEGNVGLDT